MGKKKLSSSEAPCEFIFSAHGLENLESSYPTLLKVAGSYELPLLDLSSIQMELEQILVSVVERIVCLKAESERKDLPLNVISAIKRHQVNSEPESNQTCLSKPSLVVKANPDKPLTLIISQRSGPCSTSQSILPTVSAGVSKAKPSVNAFGLRRSSRSSIEEVSELNSPSSTDKNQLALSYAIPNKFWELMEPYCAEITEANISYLEGLIRSYQHIESIYFHLPTLRQSEACKSETIEAPAQKRLRRESSHTIHQSTADESSCSFNNCNSFMTASQMLNVTKCLEAELKKPIPESSMLCKISQTLLESCYQEDILSSFSGKLNCSKQKAVSNHEAEDNYSGCTDPSGSDYGSVSTEALPTNGFNDLHASNTMHSQVNQSLSGLTLANHSLSIDPNSITLHASQPLKSIAKQFHVSSSYRVEKKIAQAIDELGLFPLNILHPKASPVVESKEDLSSNNLSSTPTCSNHSSRATKLIIRKNKITSSNSTKSGLLKVLNDGQTPLDRCSGLKKRRIMNDKTLSPLPEDENNVVSETNSADFVDTENPPIEVSSLKIRNPDVSPVNTTKKVERSWHKKISNRKNSRKNSKTLRYKNRLRNTINCKNELLCNGLSPGTNDLTISKKSDCTSGSHRDQYSPTINDTENSNTSDDYLQGHDQEGDVSLPSSPHRRNNFTSQLSCDSDKRSNESSLMHHSLRHSHSSPYHLSVTDCNGDIKPSKEFLENLEGALVNGDSSLSHFDTEKLVEHDQSRDKRNSVCNTFDEDCEPAQILEYGSHQKDEISTTPFHNNRLKLKTECNWLENTNKTDHFARKTSRETSPLMQNTDLKVSKPYVVPNTQNHTIFSSDTGSTTQYGYVGSDDISWAIIQRQRELRLLCTANHRVLRRLVQAARRDMQRQEIQRRLAIADADVIEAYNRLESYRPHRKPPLKRDRDVAWKALKERRKILTELEAFDAKSP
ncbi:unnamed protein product [Heterobilharzia americana]|nr:unnamed protein product [Heterobilharzia americana]